MSLFTISFTRSRSLRLEAANAASALARAIELLSLDPQLAVGSSAELLSIEAEED